MAVAEVRAAAGGIDLELAAPAELNGVRLLDQQRRLLRELPLAGRHLRFFLPFAWEPGESYVIELDRAARTPASTRDAAAATIPWTAPRRQPNMIGSCAAPAGQDPVTLAATGELAALAGPDGAIDITLHAENLVQSPGEFEWTVACEPGVTLGPSSAAWQREGGIWRLAGELSLAGEYAQESLHVCLDASEAGSSRPRAAALTITFRHRLLDAPDFDEESLRVTLAATSGDELRSLVRCGELRFPADAQGETQLERSRDEVALPNPVWSRVLAWLRPVSYAEDRYAEYAWQALPLSNDSPYPLNLAIQSEVRAAVGGEALMDYAPPLWKAPRALAVSEHLVRLAPGETTDAVLPVFVRPSTAPGDYERRLRVQLAGSHAPLYELSAPLYVTRGNAVRSLVVAISLVGSLAAWCLLPWTGRRVLRGMSVESLTTISLFSGAHFLVAYAARWSGDVLAGLTGPFAVFLAGVGNEGLTSILVAALLVLVPRVGVIALSSLTVFALQAMFTGQLGLVDLLMVTISILVQETLAWLFGITRAGQAAASPRDRATFGYAARMALAIGLGNAIALYAQFCLVTVLYRLFFAAWYIAAVVLLTGLIYGGLGAAAGAVLGVRLRRTAR